MYQLEMRSFSWVKEVALPNPVNCLTSYRRCEMEERNTRCLEQQVDLLRHSKKKTEQSSMKLQANIRHSVMELQEMKQNYEVTEHVNVLYHVILTKTGEVSNNTDQSMR